MEQKCFAVSLLEHDVTAHCEFCHDCDRTPRLVALVPFFSYPLPLAGSWVPGKGNAMSNGETKVEAYEAPELIEYGTIEEGRQGARAQIVDLSTGIL